MAEEMTRTTLALPSDLLERVDEAVRSGKARSRNAFVATALRHEFAAQEAADIDAAFALMADDSNYQEEAQLLSKEFETADWEAFQLAESSR